MCGIVNAANGLKLAHNWVNVGLAAFVTSTLVFAGTYYFFGLLIVIQEAWHHKTWKSIFFYPKRHKLRDCEQQVELTPTPTPVVKPAVENKKPVLKDGHEASCTYCQSTKNKAAGNQNAKIESAPAAGTKNDGENDKITTSDGTADDMAKKCPEESAADLPTDNDESTKAPPAGGRAYTPRRVVVRLDDPRYLIGGPRKGPFAIRRY
jgi:hypothetical protein